MNGDSFVSVFLLDITPARFYHRLIARKEVIHVNGL